MIKSLSALAVLSALAQSADDSHDHDSHDHEDYVESLVLLDTYDDLAMDPGNATQTESCTWDPVNEVFLFVDRNGVVGSITKDGEFAFDITDSGSAGDRILGNVFVEAGTQCGFGGDTTTCQTVPNRLYMADPALPGLRIYNVDTKTIETDTIVVPNGKTGTNGLCYDKEHDTMYAGSVGFDFTTFTYDATNYIYKIGAVSSDTPTFDLLNITTLYDQNGDLVMEDFAGFQALNGGKRQFYPNGCAVGDGKVYFSEIRLGTDTGSLGIYDIEEDEFSINTEAITVNGDDIGIYGDIVLFSTWGPNFAVNEGKILFWDSHSDATAFSVGLENVNISGPADMGDPSPDGIFCVPGFANTGEVYFVKVDCGEGDCGYEVDDSGVDGLNALFAFIMAIFVTLY